MTAWVEASAHLTAGQPLVGLAPWHDWAPGPIDYLLPAPKSPIQHPRTGCNESPICYPSPGFLMDLVTSSKPDLVVVLQIQVGVQGNVATDVCDAINIEAVALQLATYVNTVGFSV